MVKVSQTVCNTNQWLRSELSAILQLPRFQPCGLGIITKVFTRTSYTLLAFNVPLSSAEQNGVDHDQIFDEQYDRRLPYPFRQVDSLLNYSHLSCH